MNDKAPPGDSSRVSPLTIGDGIFGVAVALPMLGLFAFPLVSRHFNQMYQDMGVASELPPLTQLVIEPGNPPFFALTLVPIVFWAFRPATREKRRRVLLSLALLLGLLLLAVCGVALYLPIFELAANVDG